MEKHNKMIIEARKDFEEKFAKKQKELRIRLKMEKRWQREVRDKETKRVRTIPKTVQREVWRRDRGRCVECGGQERLEYDHIIPFSKGGSNTVRNIQLLCEMCNRKKSNTIGR